MNARSKHVFLMFLLSVVICQGGQYGGHNEMKTNPVHNVHKKNSKKGVHGKGGYGSKGTGGGSGGGKGGSKGNVKKYGGHGKGKVGKKSKSSKDTVIYVPVPATLHPTRRKHPVTRHPVAKPPVHPPVRPPTVSPVHPPTQASVHPPTQAPVHPPTNPPVHPPTNFPIHPPTTAPIHPPTNAPQQQQPVHPPTNPGIRSPIPTMTKKSKTYSPHPAGGIIQPPTPKPTYPHPTDIRHPSIVAPQLHPPPVTTQPSNPPSRVQTFITQTCSSGNVFISGDDSSTSTSSTSMNVTEANLLVRYSYSVVSTQDNFIYFEEALKADVFLVLSNMLCRLRRRLSSSLSLSSIEMIDRLDEQQQRRRRLEAVELKSSTFDYVLGPCDASPNKCQAYQGLILVTYSDVGENSNPDEITKNIASYLQFYTEHKDFSNINEAIVGMSLNEVAQVVADQMDVAAANAMDEPEEMDTVAKVSIAAGVVALSVLTLSMVVMGIRRRNRSQKKMSGF